jgi:hypothetical protein
VGVKGWHPAGGGVAGQGRGCWWKCSVERQHAVCSLSVKCACLPLITSSNSMTYSVVLMCQTVVDLHAEHVWGGGTGWLNNVQHPDRQCSRPQNYVLPVHAINHPSYSTINHCGAGGEVLRVLEAGH